VPIILRVLCSLFFFLLFFFLLLFVFLVDFALFAT
jgi:hypothetical protein